MNISSAKSQYLLQIERSNKPKATYGNRFRIALKTEKAESQAKDAATDGLESKDTMQASSTPSYTLTKEMEALYREMYGKPYKEDDPYKLEEESDEEEKLSVDEAEIASRKNGLFFTESTRADKDTPVIDFADYMVENGYFSSKEELMDYIRTGNMPDNDENQWKL